jgi:hypothetical protein
VTDLRCLIGMHHDVEAATPRGGESVPQGSLRVECSRCGRTKLHKIPPGSHPRGPIMQYPNSGGGF